MNRLLCFGLALLAGLVTVHLYIRIELLTMQQNLLLDVAFVGGSGMIREQARAHLRSYGYTVGPAGHDPQLDMVTTDSWISDWCLRRSSGLIRYREGRTEGWEITSSIGAM